MNNLNIGRYVPYNSFIHRIDARVKLAAILVLMVSLFINFSTYSTSFIYMGVLFLLTAILLYASKMTVFSIFSSLKTMWFVVILLLLIYAIIPVTNPTLPIIFTINTYSLYWDSVLMAAKIVLRLFIMLGLTMVLTATTKPLDLTYALEWYLSPLKVIKFPSAEVAMTISIALRFIPTLLEDTTRIMKAQESRGVDFKKGNIFKKVASLTSLIVPLFVSSFQRSEELANAMECRCYDPRVKRTRYRVLKFKFSDAVVLLFANLILAGFIVTSATSFSVLSIFGVSAL